MAFLCPDAPDTSGINDAARANAEIAREALAFYKDAYKNDILPAQQRQAELTGRLADDYLDTSAQQKQFAKEQNQYYKDTFQPVEKKMVSDAMSYDSADNIKRVSGEAAANVNQQFSNVRGQSARLAGRYGLTSTAMSGPAGASERAQALGAAGAATGAATATRDKGIALRSGASNFGRNMPNTSAAYFAGANNANAGAANAGQAGFSNTMAGANFMGQGFGMGIQGNNSAGALFGSEANILNTSRGQDLAFISSMMPKTSYSLSDVNAKKDIQPVSDEAALQAVKATPVSRWTYKGGMGDGGRHAGPMAQDVNKNMGEQAAPGGTKIDLVSLNGINMAATAALARKVDRLEQQVEGSHQ
jgi:hypothetical protein